MKNLKKAILFLIALTLSGCSQTVPIETSPQTSAAVNTQQTLFFRKENGMTEMISRLSPSVVGLAVTVGIGTDSVEGLGTGFFVDKSGYILTNHHVAGEADTITVVMDDGSRLAAHTVWSDRVLDLAVIRCDEGGPFTPVMLGSVEDIQVGDPVAAIGTPLDLSFQHTVTAGIVSGMNRTLQVPTSAGLSFLEELIQTDASINPGNSGGPLVTLEGKVIGINTVKVQDAEGMGFAIPIDLAQPIVKRIIDKGSFVAPYVGVTVIDKDIARYYGRDVKEGLAILNVDPEGPAHAAGIRQGDVLLAVEEVKPESVLDFRRRVYAAAIGESITLRWSRGGTLMEGECTLTERPTLD